MLYLYGYTANVGIEELGGQEPGKQTQNERN